MVIPCIYIFHLSVVLAKATFQQRNSWLVGTEGQCMARLRAPVLISRSHEPLAHLGLCANRTITSHHHTASRRDRGHEGEPPRTTTQCCTRQQLTHHGLRRYHALKQAEPIAAHALRHFLHLA